MTDTKRRTDKEALLALTELLIKHLQQDEEGEETAPDDAEASPAGHQQVALQHTRTADHDGAGEEAAPARTQEHNGSGEAAAAPWEAYLDADPAKKTPTSLIMSNTLRAKLLWVVDNVPKISQQKVMQAGAEAEADRLIALYHKPGR